MELVRCEATASLCKRTPSRRRPVLSSVRFSSIQGPPPPLPPLPHQRKEQERNTTSVYATGRTCLLRGTDERKKKTYHSSSGPDGSYGSSLSSLSESVLSDEPSLSSSSLPPPSMSIPLAPPADTISSAVPASTLSVSSMDSLSCTAISRAGVGVLTKACEPNRKSSIRDTTALTPSQSSRNDARYGPCKVFTVVASA